LPYWKQRGRQSSNNKKELALVLSQEKEQDEEEALEHVEKTISLDELDECSPFPSSLDTSCIAIESLRITNCVVSLCLVPKNGFFNSSEAKDDEINFRFQSSLMIQVIKKMGDLAFGKFFTINICEIRLFDCVTERRGTKSEVISGNFSTSQDESINLRMPGSS